MRFILGIVTILAAAIVSGCGTGGPTTSDKDILRANHDQVQEMLRSASAKKPTILVDLRTAEAYARGHLPGAIHIPLADLSASDERLAGADRVIVYHEDIKGDFPDIAAKKLMAAGLHAVYSYREGYQDWLSRQAGGGTVDEKK